MSNNTPKTGVVLPNLTQEAMMAELAALRAENAAIKLASAQKGESIKVTAKGGVSVYGMGRFPVTLYVKQWEKLIAKVPEIQAFIEANRSKLSVKAETEE